MGRLGEGAIAKLTLEMYAERKPDLADDEAKMDDSGTGQNGSHDEPKWPVPITEETTEGTTEEKEINKEKLPVVTKKLTKEECNERINLHLEKWRAEHPGESDDKPF